VRGRARLRNQEEAIKKIPESKLMDDPSAPLKVQVWTDKKQYKMNEKMNIFIKGNKPFFARVLYKDAGGGMVQCHHRFDSKPESPDMALEKIWAEEATKRWAAYKEGRFKSIPYDEVMARYRKR
jgi:putative addiction module component (TIGR02574 family)